MSQDGQFPLPEPSPGAGRPHSLLADAALGLGVLLVVVAGVIVLIISGNLAPAVAILTVSAACYLAVEVTRWFKGLPPTRLGRAFEAAVRSFLGIGPPADPPSPAVDPPSGATPPPSAADSSGSSPEEPDEHQGQGDAAT